jgi:hypothetical protein
MQRRTDELSWKSVQSFLSYCMFTDKSDDDVINVGDVIVAA